MSFNMNKLRDFGASALTFGKRNAPSIMTGGGILIGWVAAYVFWKQGRKAEEKIRAEEEKLNEDNPSEAPEDRVTLPKKDKVTIYLQYCWTALALGLGSTGLTIWAHKIDLARLAEMYMLTQFMDKQNKDQEKLINKLKSEVDKKRMNELENDILEEELPDEDLYREVLSVPGEGRTLFIDKTKFNYKFRSNIEDVKNGIYHFNEMMMKRREKAVKRQMSDAFLVSENSPYPDIPIYAEASLDEFLDFIGEGGTGSGIGTNMVFVYNGSGLCVDPDDVMRYRDFIDPDTGVAAVCYLDYWKCMVPSDEFENRRV